MHSLMRRAWVDVDLGALLRNGTALATRANVPLLPMVKADAYGLGAERISRTLERLDPWGFGVATVVSFNCYSLLHLLLQLQQERRPRPFG